MLLRYIRYEVLAVIVLALALVLLLTPKPVSNINTPIHAANVFADGYNHGDIRQVCADWTVGIKTAYRCEKVIIQQMGLSFAFTGVPSSEYSVVPRSEKMWVQNYAGREIKMATVEIHHGNFRETMHLQEVDGRWLVWYLS